jgi:hypothetical protein
MTSVTASPPDLDNPQERRLIMRFYRLWAARAAGRSYPALVDLSREDLLPFKDHTILIDLQEGYDNPKLRVIGSHIAAQLETSLLGAAPDAAPRGSILSRVTDHYLEVLANKAPVAFEAEFKLREGWEILYRAILVPLSRHDDRVEFVMGVINWKRADAPAQAVTATAAPQLASEDMEEAPAEAQDMEAIMADRVYHLRDQALTAGRSRRELYDLLVDIYRFWLWIAADADAAASYARVLAQDGLKAQRRAPFTALLKVVFGPSYDKTRLTEYAAALSYAQRQGWDEATLAAALAADGGMKAMVRSERHARSNAGKPAEDPAAAVADLPALAALAPWPMEIPSHDVVVLVGVREHGQGQNQNLKIVAAADGDTDALRPVVRRLLREKSRENG